MTIGFHIMEDDGEMVTPPTFRVVFVEGKHTSSAFITPRALCAMGIWAYLSRIIPAAQYELNPS